MFSKKLILIEKDCLLHKYKTTNIYYIYYRLPTQWFIFSQYKTMMHEVDEIAPISHSLEADMATGWKPKLKIIGPMPLNYDNPPVDKSIKALLHQQSAFYQIVYLGFRPSSSFRLHEQLARQYRYKYTYLLHTDFAHLKQFFKIFYSLFESEVKRPFFGMNPSIFKKELIFDSCFEGGNLDCAVRLKSQQYDLLLRVDSNTAGHVLWYYFRVTNAQNAKKNIKFNIANLRKNKSAYERVPIEPYPRACGLSSRGRGESGSRKAVISKFLMSNCDMKSKI